jgi:hypothetical protein
MSSRTPKWGPSSSASLSEWQSSYAHFVFPGSQAADDEPCVRIAGRQFSGSSNRPQHGGFTAIECFAARQQRIDAQGGRRATAPLALNPSPITASVTLWQILVCGRPMPTLTNYARILTSGAGWSSRSRLDRSCLVVPKRDRRSPRMSDRGFRYTGRWLRLLPAPHPSRP